MKYDAITFDTEVADRNNYRFDSGLLAQLKQFATGPTQVVISGVVSREMLKHLTDRTRAAKDKFLTAHRKARSFKLLEAEATAFGEIEPDAAAIAKGRLEAFFTQIGAVAAKADDVRMSELLRMYFNVSPPFEGAKDKKSEFPDAIALLSLEAWANAEDKRILAVSGDNGWSAYAETSERIDVIKNLGDALVLLQRHADEAVVIAKSLLQSMWANPTDDLAVAFERLLSNAVDEYTVDGEADSNYHIETDYVFLTLEEFEFLDLDQNSGLSIVQYGPKKIVIRLRVELTVQATGTFSLSVHDSTDDDYLSVGNVEATRETYLDTAILATFEGDFHNNDLVVSKVEIVDAPHIIQFGYVEADDNDGSDYNEGAEETFGEPGDEGDDGYQSPFF